MALTKNNSPTCEIVCMVILCIATLASGVTLSVLGTRPTEGGACRDHDTAVLVMASTYFFFGLFVAAWTYLVVLLTRLCERSSHQKTADAAPLLTAADSAEQVVF